jgi:hypothetical protein
VTEQDFDVRSAWFLERVYREFVNLSKEAGLSRWGKNILASPLKNYIWGRNSFDIN